MILPITVTWCGVDKPTIETYFFTQQKKRKKGSQYITSLLLFLFIIIIFFWVIGEFHMHLVGFKRMTLPFIPLSWEKEMLIEL